MFVEASRKAKAALLSGLKCFENRVHSFERVCRIAVLTTVCVPALAERVQSAAKPDGGWMDVSETLWCLAYLKEVGLTESLAPGLRWLGSQRKEGGGWGQSERDTARIPTTALILRFLARETGSEADWRCIERLWEEDLGSEVQLTYKGGFYLLCHLENSKRSPKLLSRTFQYLEASQNEDGGFAPWKNHPIGSDPWSTGICLAGLCSHPELAPHHCVERAVEWLLRTQLPSGLWPYHFIDEGSAYALWGLREAATVLGDR